MGMRTRSRACILAAGALLASACGSSGAGEGSLETGAEPPEQTSADPEREAPPGVPPGPIDELLVSCGSSPGYPPSALEGPTGAEADDDSAATALRDLIEDPDGIEPLPENEWRRLHDDGDTVVFGSGQPSDNGTGEGLTEVVLERTNDEFTFHGSNYNCQPRPLIGEMSLASFDLAQGAAPGPDSTSVEVLVTEVGCTGATPVDDRLQEPVVEYGDSTVDVVYFAEPLEGDAFPCPSNPSTETILELSEPLGDRELRDASSFPPRQATEATEPPMPPPAVDPPDDHDLPEPGGGVEPPVPPEPRDPVDPVDPDAPDSDHGQIAPAEPRELIEPQRPDRPQYQDGSAPGIDAEP